MESEIPRGVHPYIYLSTTWLYKDLRSRGGSASQSQHRQLRPPALSTPQRRHRKESPRTRHLWRIARPMVTKPIDILSVYCPHPYQVTPQTRRLAHGTSPEAVAAPTSSFIPRRLIPLLILLPPPLLVPVECATEHTVKDHTHRTNPVQTA